MKFRSMPSTSPWARPSTHQAPLAGVTWKSRQAGDGSGGKAAEGAQNWFTIYSARQRILQRLVQWLGQPSSKDTALAESNGKLLQVTFCHGNLNK